jgi:hypothetical protein
VGCDQVYENSPLVNIARSAKEVTLLLVNNYENSPLVNIARSAKEVTLLLVNNLTLFLMLADPNLEF